MKKLLAFIVTGLFLTGCADATNQAEGQKPEATVSTSIMAEETFAVTITVNISGEEIENGTKELEVERGANLLEVMKKNFEIVEQDNFINSIDGHKQDEESSKYWIFDLNGEMAPTGANDTVLQEGDVVEWKLEAM